MELMEQISKQEIKTIVVAHQDRLCRFGFDFIEWFCNINRCEVVVLNNSYKLPHQELIEDFISIMHYFSSKLNFLKKYEKTIRAETKTDSLRLDTSIKLLTASKRQPKKLYG